MRNCSCPPTWFDKVSAFLFTVRNVTSTDPTSCLVSFLGPQEEHLIPTYSLSPEIVAGGIFVCLVLFCFGWWSPLYSFARAACHKVPQTEWLNQQKCITVLEVQHSKCRCRQGLTQLRAVRERSVPGSLCGLDMAIFSLCLFTSSFLYADLCPSYKDTSHIELWPTLMTSFWLDYLYKYPISK